MVRNAQPENDASGHRPERQDKHESDDQREEPVVTVCRALAVRKVAVLERVRRFGTGIGVFERTGNQFFHLAVLI